MPEGHTLHRLAARFQAVVVGRPWRVTSPQSRFAGGAAVLDGRTPHRAEAWGKHLFVHADDHVWHVHLGLYGAFSFGGDEEFLRGLAGAGSMGAPRAGAPSGAIRRGDDGRVIPEEPRGAVRARIVVRDGWADLRGPATCRVLTGPEYAQVLGRLGPDPLRTGDGGDPAAEFLHRLSTRRIPIAQALMDQGIIAGIGNIYRAESLFLEGIDPYLPARSLDARRVHGLWDRLGDQLRDGVAEGIIRTFRPEEADPSTAAPGRDSPDGDAPDGDA
ncbi:MAG: Fpg/Nei family DNA glycosylase, partial [Nesterenkonia sp.]|nr:Fpg/Nei family DNA glycosylase [Nesterenkonia sp.]